MAWFLGWYIDELYDMNDEIMLKIKSTMEIK